ncbi:tetraspanin-5-like [Rutidosis leptorrhynchoides]|uniref:tetraspanin-5-like n=1 Tax=Rutidosis leptorrhynchoides TaxID=125765 RepID=UPI003A99CE97
MGMFGKLLLTIWLIGGTSGSMYLVGRRFVEMGSRVVQLHNETCLEDPVLWPTWLMTLVLVSCVLGLMGIVCKLKLFQWLFKILINLGILYVIAIMVWRLLMFGWLRKPTSTSFEEVYKKNSPLDEEFKPRLIQAMAADHEWEKVNECLNEIQFCEGARGPEKFFKKDDWKIEDFYEYFREGCCVPPQRCPKQLISLKEVSEKDDCMKWANATLNNPLQVKCYNCNSCKAARLATYQVDQDKVRMYTFLAAIFLFIANVFVSMGGFD